MKERKKKNRHTYTKEKTRMQRENKRTGETLSKNKTKTSNKRIKQTSNWNNVWTIVGFVGIYWSERMKTNGKQQVSNQIRNYKKRVK